MITIYAHIIVNMKIQMYISEDLPGWAFASCGGFPWSCQSWPSFLLGAAPAAAHPCDPLQIMH